MSPSFIRNSRGNIGVVLVKYKSIKLPAVFNKDAEIVSEVRLVVKIGNQLQIFYESTADILKLSDLTETERLSVKENYDLDEKFYPTWSEINKGMEYTLDQINHCMSKCIAGLVRFDSDLKWPEKEGRERIDRFIRGTEVGKLVLEVNGEITSRK